MSMPWCMRPQRQPNGLVIGPLTGQIRPGGRRRRASGRSRRPAPARRGSRSPIARARRLQRVDLARLRLLGGGQLSRGRSSFLLLRRREIARRADELVAHVARLRGARARSPPSRPGRSRAAPSSSRARPSTCAFAVRDLARRSAGPASPISFRYCDLVERVLHVARAEEDVERRGVARTRRCRRAAGSSVVTDSRVLRLRGTRSASSGAGRARSARRAASGAATRSASSVCRCSETSPTFASSARMRVV